MAEQRVFLDTVFTQALLNRRDQYHAQARALLPEVRQAQEVWVTEAVLVEVGNALAALNRQAATRFIRQCYRTPNIQIVSVDSSLLREALDLYTARRDKSWGLTDCISFVVMRQRDLTAAVTANSHFAQAGFRTLMPSH